MTALLVRIKKVFCRAARICSGVLEKCASSTRLGFVMVNQIAPVVLTSCLPFAPIPPPISFQMTLNAHLKSSNVLMASASLLVSDAMECATVTMVPMKDRRVVIMSVNLFAKCKLFAVPKPARPDHREINVNFICLNEN